VWSFDVGYISLTKIRCESALIGTLKVIYGLTILGESDVSSRNLLQVKWVISGCGKYPYSFAKFFILTLDPRDICADGFHFAVSFLELAVAGIIHVE
jgi:hypothetical protein